MAVFYFNLKSFEIDGKKVIEKRGLNTSGMAQQFIDSEVLRLCDPYVPKDTGALIDSGIINTQIGSGKVKYRTPYARRWYYMPADFHDASMRGNYWFERMKAQGGKDKILRGIKRITGGNG